MSRPPNRERIVRSARRFKRPERSKSTKDNATAKKWYQKIKPGWLVFWAVFAGAAAILGVAVDIPSFLAWRRSQEPPSLEISYFRKDDAGNLSLVDPSKVMLTVDPEDMTKRQIRLPLNIAVRNLEKRDLQDAKIVFTYDKDAAGVEPQGKPLVNRDARTLTYQHELRDLAPVGEFTPLDTIDVLHIRYEYLAVPNVALTRDGVPLYTLAFVGMNPDLKEKVIKVGVRFEIPGRPLITGTLNYRLGLGVNILGFEGEAGSRRSPRPDEVAWFKSPALDAKKIDFWEKPYKGSGGSVLRYEKYDLGGQAYQRISIDGQVRRLIIDRNNDQHVDSDVMDTTQDGIPDTAAEGGTRYMPDWPPEAG